MVICKSGISRCADERFLLTLSGAEGEGLGMWYEYLAKLRVLPESGIDTVLIAGLPEIYGLGVDMLRFAQNGAKTVFVDPREKTVVRLRQIIAEKMHPGRATEVLKCADLTRLDFSDNSFDLVCSSECLQAYPDRYIQILREMVRVSRQHVICFVSNGYCYAHPGISGLNSFKMGRIKRELADIPGIKVKAMGYIDIPPWPSGISVTVKRPGTPQQVSCPAGSCPVRKAVFECLKAGMMKLIPRLARAERFYFTPVKQLLAHFIYFHLVKET